MKEVSLLMLGGGKRVSLLKSFHNAAKVLNLKLVPYSYEIDRFQPISSVSETIVGRRWSDPEADEDILNISKSKGIDLIISNVDPATVIQSRLKRTLKAAALCSDTDITEICLNKNDFQNLCEKLGFRIIPRAVPGVYPQFAKPARGSASNGTIQINSSSEIDNQSKFVDYIFQKYVQGPEFTVDAYVSLSGDIIGISPRKRIQTLGGESIITETFYDEKIIESCSEIILKLDLRGPLTLQFIKSEATGELYLMEINPRFAGGVLASIAAGFDFPRMMLEDTLGVTPFKVSKGKKILMKRYFEEVYFEIDN